MSKHLPHAELSDPDLDGCDPATSSGPGAGAAAAERDQTAPESSVGWDALVALVRLLARQAAKELMSEAE